MKTLRMMLTFAAMLAAATLAAQTNVQIVGTSEGAAGKTIELYCYEDMLSGGEVLLDVAEIDSTGAFRLGCYVTYPRLVFVQVENYSQSFYIEAGRHYRVFLPDFDWNIDEKRNIHLAPVALPLEFIGVGDDELNIRIGRFDAVVDSFIDSNRVWFDKKYKPNKRYMDSLSSELKRRGVAPKSLDANGVTFYDRYAEYSMGELKLAMRSQSRGKLIGQYIADQPIRYYDEPYMRLFFALYANSISQGTRRVPQWRLSAWIEEGNYDRYMDSIGLDPLLKNERIRELAVLEALKESYYDRNYNRERVKEMVAMLAERTRFEEHRTLANHLLAMMQRGESGFEMPDFTLPDVDRNMVNLEDMRGKWIYLSFVRVDDPNSLKEIETMAFFRDSVYANNPDVEFVTVACDREFQKMYHLLKNSRRGARYNWTWLHFDGNYKLLEHYEVVSYPTFVLLDPDGKLFYSVTPPPASGILMRGPWVKKKEVPDSKSDDRFRF